MWRIDDMPLSRRITLGMVLVAGLALILSSIAYTAFQSKLFKETKTQRAFTMARVVGDNSRAALAFNDTGAASGILQSLSADPDFQRACLYDANGAVFATYPIGLKDCPAMEPGDLEAFQGSQLRVFHTIIQGDEKLGGIFLQVGSEDMKAAFRWHLAFTLSLLVALVLLAIALSFRVQRVITAPLLELAYLARRVSQEKDYSVRAERNYRDEIGLLVDAFNGMLEQIQTRDTELAGHREHLEELVTLRTGELSAANEALEVAKQRAEAVSRTKSAFLANMSHELRTPLNAIMLYTDLLKEQAAGAGRTGDVQDLDRISGSADHLLRLINDVLDLSKIEAGKMTLMTEAIQLDVMAEEIAQTIRPLAEKQGNRLEASWSEGTAPFLGDATKLRQILFNLLSNACKFTERGEVSLRVTPFLRADAAWLRYTVRDTGIGMTPDQLERIFQDFTQAEDSTSKRYGGTGLGLSLSRRLCQLMGGYLRVESTPGVGSTFTLELPAPPLSAGGSLG